METVERTILLAYPDGDYCEIEVRKRGQYYAIYINDEFWSSCEVHTEIDDELKHIKKVLGLRSILG